MDTKRMQSYRLSEQTIEAIGTLADELGVSKAESVARAVAALGAARRAGARMASMAETGRDHAMAAEDRVRRDQEEGKLDRLQMDSSIAGHCRGMADGYQYSADLLAEALVPFIGVKGISPWSDGEFPLSDWARWQTGKSLLDED